MRRGSGVLAAIWIVAAGFGCGGAGSTGAGPGDAAVPSAPAEAETANEGAQWLTQDEMIEDVGQLVDFYEATHPDPYGPEGKLGFHRRVHVLLRSLPEEGLSPAAFHSRIQPLLAVRGDGHTVVKPMRTIGDEASGPGLPIDFKIVAADEREPRVTLHVQGVAGATASYAGSRLESVAGVAMSEIIEREREWEAYENESGNLANLVWRLWSEKGLQELLPEWEPGDSVGVVLRTPSGERVALTLPRGRPPRTWEGEGLGPVGKLDLELPETMAGVPAYRFVDRSRRTALLRLDNTWAHREIFEGLLKGNGGPLGWAQTFYRMYHEEEPPESVEAMVLALPPAQKILEGLVSDMKTAGTETLVVDLRRNSGGHSVLVNMLLYYLYGRDGWAEFFGNFSTIRRLTAADLDGGAASERKFPERVGDYDFSSEFEAATKTASEAGDESYLKRLTTDFAQELESSRYEGYYAPPRVVAVVSPQTFSGGFWVAAALWRMGAQVVGVPSGQAPNQFANVRTTTLGHSGIAVGVSSRRFVLFPEHPDMRVLPVDVPLTLDAWRQTGWSPNASLMLALPAGGGDAPE